MIDNIRKIIQDNGQITPKEIQRIAGLGPAMVFRHLKKLVGKGDIVKVGTSPKVFYKINEQPDNRADLQQKIESKIMEENFDYISPEGEEIEGVEGFERWCSLRKLNPIEMKGKYEEVYTDYQRFSKNGVIDATEKIEKTFANKSNEQYLSKLYYLTFYSYPIFGRNKISNWLFYGKTLQQKKLIKKVIDTEREKIYKFILDQKVDAIMFVPPTVPRKIQFMKELENELNLSLPKVLVTKAVTPIIIQQKSLKDITERVKNADLTMFVQTRNTNYKRLLIIDDFTGSGATLNTLAKKCLKQNVADEVIGLTITGSINGFEVIREI